MPSGHHSENCFTTTHSRTQQGLWGGYGPHMKSGWQGRRLPYNLALAVAMLSMPVAFYVLQVGSAAVAAAIGFVSLASFCVAMRLAALAQRDARSSAASRETQPGS